MKGDPTPTGLGYDGYMTEDDIPRDEEETVEEAVEERIGTRRLGSDPEAGTVAEGTMTGTDYERMGWTRP